MIKRALITGATGFVGGAVAQRLCDLGWDVHLIVRPASDLNMLGALGERSSIHMHDGTTANMLDIVEKARPDIVFHLASLFIAEHTVNDVDRLITSNLLFSTQLAEAAAKFKVKGFINTGTSWQHFRNESYCPVNLYAATKEAFENILRWYYDAQTLSCVTLKLFDTYGPGDRRRKLINILVDAAKNGTQLNMSPGAQILDLSYIDDVVDAYIVTTRLLLESKAPLFHQFAISGERLTLRDLVALFAKISGNDLDVNFGARPYRDREVMVPWSAAEKTLPCWQPSVGLDLGIKRMMAPNEI